MEPARTTQEAYRNCDAETPLRPGDPAYVDLAAARDWDENFDAQVAWGIAAAPAREGTSHISLVSGHRGCGKSTELRRLRKALEEKGWAVAYFDAFEILDQNDLEASDVMVALCEQVAQLAQEKGKGFDENALRLVYDYFAVEEEAKDHKRVSELSVETGADLGGIPGFLKLFANLRANMKGSEEVRLNYRRRIEKNFNSFALRLKELVRSAENALKDAGHQGLFVIVDSLEKLPYTKDGDGRSSHERFFQLHADMLKCPPCHVVYTVPITLTSEELLSNTYGSPAFVVPMIDTRRSEARASLRELLDRRVVMETVFEPDTDVEAFIDASGGCVRDLLRLVRQAVFVQTAPVPASRVEDAIGTLTKEYDRLFNDPDIPAILECAKTRHQDYDETGRRLLYRRVILEYENGDRWALPHPLVLRNPRVVAAGEEPPEEPRLGL